jgi:ferredoxin-NADP reductase
MKLKLIERKKQAGDATTFIFKSEDGMGWQAGQYMHYVLKHKADERGDERWFTISNAPHEKNIAITTRILPTRASSFKSALNQLPIGGLIEADGPKGKFVIDKPNEFLVFIAGGIGITPFRSMILEASHNNILHNGVLLYANRDENIVFKDELEEAAPKIGVGIKYFIGPEILNADAILGVVPNLTKPYFYISGPEPMVEHFENTLLGLGFVDEQIKRDSFPGYEWPLE